MNWPLAAALAGAGLVIGWCLRPVVFRLAAGPGAPARTCCPRCGQPVAGGGRLARPAEPVGPRPAEPVGPRPAEPVGPRPAEPAAPSPADPDPADRNPPPRVVPFLTWPRQAPPARCPGCLARTGPPPLVLELATAILLGLLGARVHPGLVLAAACWLAVCAIPLAWVDAAVRRLPDVLTAPAYAGTVALLVAAAAAGGHWRSLLSAAAGGLGLAAGYLVLAAASRGAVGLGDAKLAAPLGTLLAWYGWPALLAGTFAGFLLGAIYGIGLLAARRATGKHRIAFGPFMIVGAFIVVLAAA